MENEFIKELRDKAREGSENAYKENIKKENPWVSNDIINEKFFEEYITRMFNSERGEER